jgi:hypothetical protein
MNHNRLQQDHPCVISYIRRHYLNVPPSTDIPLQLDYPEVEDPSDGQSNKILKLLNNKVSACTVLNDLMFVHVKKLNICRVLNPKIF